MPTTAGNYFLTSDVTISSAWEAPSGTNLCLNGYGIRVTGNSAVINLYKGRTLHIFDCNPTREHYITLSNFRGTAVSDTGTETEVMGGNGVVKVMGGYITGGNNGVGGGGIYSGNTAGGANLYIQGVTFIGNKATGLTSYGQGSAICAYTQGILSLDGTKFYYNAAYRDQGQNAFTIHRWGGTTIFKDVDVQNNVGGGVITANGTVMSGKTIIRNNVISTTNPTEYNLSVTSIDGSGLTDGAYISICNASKRRFTTKNNAEEYVEYCHVDPRFKAYTMNVDSEGYGIITKKIIGHTLNVVGDGGTASLLKSSFAPLTSDDQIAVDDKFVLCVDANDDHGFAVDLSSGNNNSVKEFTESEYASYLAYAKENNIPVSENTALAWITMPYVENEHLTVTVDFAKQSSFTVLYQTSETSDEVWCKLLVDTETNTTNVFKMNSEFTLGDGTAVYSLDTMSDIVPAKVVFGTSEEAVETVEIAGMTDVTVQTDPVWTDISSGKFCVIGGSAKTVVAAFVSDADATAVYHNSSAEFDPNTKSDGVTYRIAICPTDSDGNVISDGTVTAPAAPAKDGYDFAGWRGMEGTAPNQTEKIYNVGDSIGISENTTLNAVWNRKNPTVTLNLNGGTGGSDITSVTYGSKLTISQNPTKTGYAFDGWTVSEAVTENGVYFAKNTAFDLNTPITDNLKLTAQWKHVHSYTNFRITRFSALSEYHKYDSAIHIAVCSCDDVQLVAHEFDKSLFKILKKVSEMNIIEQK